MKANVTSTATASTPKSAYGRRAKLLLGGTALGRCFDLRLILTAALAAPSFVRASLVVNVDVDVVIAALAWGVAWAGLLAACFASNAALWAGSISMSHALLSLSSMAPALWSPASALAS
jgi:hypothetical protein